MLWTDNKNNPLLIKRQKKKKSAFYQLKLLPEAKWFTTKAPAKFISVKHEEERSEGPASVPAWLLHLAVETVPEEEGVRTVLCLDKAAGRPASHEPGSPRLSSNLTMHQSTRWYPRRHSDYASGVERAEENKAGPSGVKRVSPKTSCDKQDSWCCLFSWLGRHCQNSKEART